MPAKKKLHIEGKEVTIREENGMEWFSLNELAKKFSKGDSSIKIRNYFTNKDNLNFLETYEGVYNEEFNSTGMGQVRNNNLRNDTKVSPGDYVTQTNAKFIKVKQGRYGGTFANFDIASHFMMWLSSIFMVYFIRDYRRMKEIELQESKSLQTFYAQKNVDNLMETLRNEQDRLELLKKEKIDLEQKLKEER